jgi:hypothetical protein
MTAKVECNHSDGSLKINVEGQINEATLLPSLDDLPNGIASIDFNFSDSAYLNSEGIKMWLLWLIKLRKSIPTAKIHFEKVSVYILNLGAVIDGLIPSDATFSVIRVPYYCSTCGNNEMADFALNEPQADGGPRKDGIQVKTCSQCNSTSDLDGVYEKISKYLI